MQEAYEYKGIEFEIELIDSAGQWHWTATVPGMSLDLQQMQARDERVARKEAIEAAHRAVNAKLGPQPYKRAADGKDYTYLVDYVIEEPNRRSSWHAKVYLGEELVGTPEGMAFTTNIAGLSLYSFVCRRVEECIENGLEITT